MLQLSYTLPHDEHYDTNAPGTQNINEMGIYFVFVSRLIYSIAFIS